MKSTSRRVGVFEKKIIDMLQLKMEENTPIYIGDVNETHIKKRHPYEYDKYFDCIADIIAEPNYIGINPKDNSIEYVKLFQINKEYIRVGIKVSSNGFFFVRTLHLLSSCNAEKYINNGSLILEFP